MLSDSLEKTWCSERLRAGGEGDDRGQDGWMASLAQWIWVWANSRRWWRIGKPGVLQSMGSQRGGHDLVTEQQQFYKQGKWDSEKLLSQDCTVKKQLSQAWNLRLIPEPPSFALRTITSIKSGLQWGPWSAYWKMKKKKNSLPLPQISIIYWEPTLPGKDLARISSSS